ncbi:hypothetical protein HYT00_02520 [Candidatus Giovannonibacteria bacterium]|nr:hypothetical protein [Candidatus Giovannonibacteria bacterium]
MRNLNLGVFKKLFRSFGIPGDLLHVFPADADCITLLAIYTNRINFVDRHMETRIAPPWRHANNGAKFFLHFPFSSFLKKDTKHLVY